MMTTVKRKTIMTAMDHDDDHGKKEDDHDDHDDHDGS